MESNFYFTNDKVINKKRRIFELFLILMVGFSISKVKSVFMFLGLYKNSEIPEIPRILAIISKITAILVTLYILFFRITFAITPIITI